ncbi:16S rRNA (guanine(966)-N(2))-methyltransferase RsmD [Subtercola sp. YIM 133946]|uniref:16S rRNA (guanine(966)-N(2))-methyltransferase RsmD n=1 Tax=Subtercola sp. YIM 133946 TaxID=3118909 RepID=UPI002F92AE95
MTRIIAGFAGSQRLAVPSAGTRPTSDRVREAIFSALQSRDLITGSAVLDLYAGSGALGLEAASRGAAEVTLVEKSPAAARVARANGTIIHSAAAASKATRPRITVAAQAVTAFLGTSPARYDIVFVDPPYDLGEAELADTLHRLVHHVESSGTVVVERTSRSPAPLLPAGLTLDRRKDYGETTLWWFVAD